MINKITRQGVILLILFLLTVILAALIVRPLLTTILTALIIGYVFYPLYRFIKNKIKNKSVSAITVSVFIVLLVIIPTFFLANTLANEAYIMYTRTKQVIVTGEPMLNFCEGETGLFCSSFEKVKGTIGDKKIRYYMQQGLEKITNSVIRWATGIALAVPLMIFQGMIILFILFYFFKDHRKIVDKLKLIIPLKNAYRKDILKRIQDVTYAIVFGYIVVAILEGIVGVIGFKLFFPNSAYVLWGTVIAFLALIPMIGATVIWIPAIIIQILNGNYFLTIGLVVCMCTTSYIDIVTRSKLVGERAQVHPVYILLGVIGGVILIGVPGAVIGPLTLALLNTFLKIFTGK